MLSLPLPPIQREVILVQSRGMARWLSLQIASRLGVLANIYCPFPNSFINDIFQKLCPDHKKIGFDKEIAAWHIMQLLPALQTRPSFFSIREYLSDVSDLKRLQLAMRIADLFDQYIIYRPDLILGWDEGAAEGDWQAELWREVMPLFKGNHRAAMQRICLERLHSEKFGFGDLPERLSVFGVSSLPPFHLEVFTALSNHIDVNFYLLNPCAMYWGDIVSEREIAHITRKRNLPEQELYLDKGNSLLAATGQLGRDFFELLQEMGCRDTDFFVEPSGDSLLSAIHGDIVHLEEASLKQDLSSRKQIGPDDRSIAIHSCHSPMREIEVLRDQLLFLFDNDPDLKPKDILVMAPDIELYSPLIQAVFDAPLGDRQRIPYSIADRSVSKEGQALKLFLSVIGLAKSRYGVNRVRDIIGSPFLYKKFGLSAEDLELVDLWLKKTLIHWGIDSETRKKLNLPGFDENTWHFGLDRLLLGYSMAGHDENMFRDILPFDEIEGSETQVLGRFLDCINTLFEHVGKLEKNYSLQGWAEILKGLFDALFHDADIAAYESRLLHNCIHKLKSFENAAGFRDELGIEVIRSYVAGAFEQEASPFGFITGGITFCAMLPMRAVPFKVVCLLGMNDRDYPRLDKTLSFNKMAKAPRRGDRSRRLDDRYIFLEALLAARNYFCISYVGQSIQDDSKQNPSVLVSELVEYIKRNFKSENDTIEEQVITCHPLQPFNPDYFKQAGQLFSYSKQNCNGAKALMGKKNSVPFLIAKSLEEPSAEMRVVDLSQLVYFFMQPVRFFCRNRLGIVLYEQSDILEEKEPFTIDGLDRFQLESTLIDKYLGGRNPEEFHPAIQAAGLLPHGNLGAVLYHELSDEVRKNGLELRQFTEAALLEPLAISMEFGEFTLNAQMHTIYESGFFQFKCSGIKEKDLLRHWLQHLVINAAPGAKYPQNSVLVGKEATYYFNPVHNSEKIVHDLLMVYWRGLCEPLPFYPMASYAYASSIVKGESESMAVQRAQNKWVGNGFHKAAGEAEDPYYKMCFRDRPPFDVLFRKLALQIYEPLIACSSRVKR